MIPYNMACYLCQLERLDEAKSRLAKALEIAHENREAEQDSIRELRESLRTLLVTAGGCTLNGPTVARLAGNLNLSFEHVDGEALLASLEGIAASTGSACTSADLAPSHVLLAMGLSEDEANECVRISWSFMTSQVDWEEIAKREHQLLVFGNTHDDTENLAYDVRTKSRGKVEIKGRNIVEIKPHYAGINNKERKAAENEFRDGDIDALSCTSTLELGIDIGSVDAVISQFTNNYHHFVQRVGRAGRVGQPAYGISVFNPDEPTSHYFSNNIKEYRAQKHEVKIQTENKAIAGGSIFMPNVLGYINKTLIPIGDLHGFI